MSKYEALQTKSNNNEQYCIKLENKLKSLNEELPDKDEATEHTPPNENENNEIVNLKHKVTSQTVLIGVYLKQIEQFTREKDSLEAKLAESQQSNSSIKVNTSTVDLGELEDLNDEERSRLLPIIEQQVKNRYRNASIKRQTPGAFIIIFLGGVYNIFGQLSPNNYFTLNHSIIFNFSLSFSIGHSDQLLTRKNC